VRLHGHEKAIGLTTDIIDRRITSVERVLADLAKQLAHQRGGVRHRASVHDDHGIGQT
jgi:hypothetical protein